MNEIWIISEEMKIRRPLLIMSVGFVLGEVWNLLFSVGKMMPVLLAACLAWTFFLFSSQWRKKGAGRGAWLCILTVFCLLGMWRAQEAKDAICRELSLNLDGLSVAAEGKIQSISLRESSQSMVLNDCCVWDDAGKRSIGRLLVYFDSCQEDWKIGSAVQVKGVVSLTKPPRNPGEFDYQRYYWSQKICYRMTAEDLMQAGNGYSRMGDFLFRCSLGAAEILDQIGEPEDAGLYKAILLGNKGFIGDEIYKLYQTCGIAHLLAISGLHLACIGGAVYGTARRMGLGFFWSGFSGGSFLYAYAIMAGASPSVMRALAMIVCSYAAAALGRTYDLLSAVSLSAILLLWESPYLIFQSGFQLSFSAVLGIGLAAPALGKLFSPNEAERASDTSCRILQYSGEMNWMGKLLAVPLGMQMITLPVVLYHFFQIPLYGIFLNLAAVPMMGMVLLSGIGGVLAGMIHPAAGRFALGCGHVMLELYERLCQWNLLLPGNVQIMGRPRLWQIALYYLGLFLILKSCHKFNNHNGEWRWRKNGVLVAMMLLMPLLLRPAFASGLWVTFLDVGQGDGICIRTEKATILIDGGSSDQKKLGEDSLEPFLKSLGVRMVDYAIVTHGDEDHISGLRYLLESSEVGIRCLMVPEAGKGDAAYQQLTEPVKRRGGKVCWVEKGEQVKLGELIMTCLHPEDDAVADRNQQSLVWKVDYGAFHMLLTGDMSESGERQILGDRNAAAQLSQIQVLKVAHHGSASSTSADWLRQVSPRWAVISCGENNRYGHPAPEVLERLEEQQVFVFGTARSGAVSLHTDGQAISWETFLKKGA